MGSSNLGIINLSNFPTKDNPVLKDLSVIKEVFVPVKGYEGIYEISNFGTLRNNRKNMKTYKINSGYQAAKLVRNGVRESILIHRLVAMHFLPPIPGANEVNHINHEKLDNSVQNLEWVTSKENKSHSKLEGWTEYNEPTKGTKLGKTSRYHNVLWDSSRQKWVGVVRYQNKNHFQKRFDSEDDAARHVNWILDQLNLADRPRNTVI